jgi:hypothetical protein
MSVVVSCVLLQQARFCSQEGQEIFHFSKTCRPAVRPAHPLAQWVLGFFPQEESGWGVKLAAYLYLMLGLRISGTILLLCNMPSWHVKEQLYLYLNDIVCVW